MATLLAGAFAGRLRAGAPVRERERETHTHTAQGKLSSTNSCPDYFGIKLALVRPLWVLVRTISKVPFA